MEWQIVADSACDMREKDLACDEVAFSTVPFTLQIGETAYVDEETLDIAEMVEAMEACPTACRSACPSAQAWLERFKQAEKTIVMTISGNLSGSLNSALAAKDMLLEKWETKKVAILDSLSTGPEMALCLQHVKEWIKNGHPMESVTEKAEEFLQKCKTSFALCSFDNLVKNGRMSRLTGFIARKLGMWGIGIASDEGTIAIKGKSRGALKAITLILEDMKERGFTGGEVAISHCFNEDMARRLKAGILEIWNTAKVSILKTRGLDSFYAERGGLIVAFC